MKSNIQQNLRLSQWWLTITNFQDVPTHGIVADIQMCQRSLLLFHTDDPSSSFLWNLGTYLTNYLVPQPKDGFLQCTIQRHFHIYILTQSISVTHCWKVQGIICKGHYNLFPQHHISQWPRTLTFRSSRMWYHMVSQISKSVRKELLLSAELTLNAQASYFRRP
jgi:hypothetical protein